MVHTMLQPCQCHWANCFARICLDILGQRLQAKDSPQPIEMKVEVEAAALGKCDEAG
jgi:hypothetical protein